PEDLKSIDQGQSSCKECGLDQQGPGNKPETLNFSGSVYPGRLVKAFRNSQKARKPQDHIIAQVFPDIYSHQYPEGRRTVHIIWSLYMEIFKKMVQDSFPFKEKLPEKHHRSRRHCHGKEKAAF